MAVEITVKEIIQPKPGKKQGALIDTSNRRWQVWADKLYLYTVGGTYDILTTKTSSFNGQEYVTIDDMMPVVRQGASIHPTPNAPTAYTGSPQSAPVAVPQVQ